MNLSWLKCKNKRSRTDRVLILDVDGFAHFFRVILALHFKLVFLPRFFFFVSLNPLGFGLGRCVMCKQLIKFSWMSLTFATPIKHDCL